MNPQDSWDAQRRLKLSEAILIVNDPANTQAARSLCQDRNFEIVTETDPDKALELCRNKPPDLVIVEDPVAGKSAKEVISQALKISWTIASIVISEEDEETIHDKMEGLGILGHMTSYDDTETLSELLEKHRNLMQGA